MNKYIYLTCNPEALVASMLPPEAFGRYLSTGTKKRNRGQAIFFEVDLDQIETCNRSGESQQEVCGKT